jgi:hypothetical protein
MVPNAYCHLHSILAEHFKLISSGAVVDMLLIPEVRNPVGADHRLVHQLEGPALEEDHRSHPGGEGSEWEGGDESGSEWVEQAVNM